MPNDIGALLRALLVGKDNRPDLPPAPMKADFNSPPPRGVKNDGKYISGEKLQERDQTYEAFKHNEWRRGKEREEQDKVRRELGAPRSSGKDINLPTDRELHREYQPRITPEQIDRELRYQAKTKK